MNRNNRDQIINPLRYQRRKQIKAAGGIRQFKKLQRALKEAAK